MQNLPTLTELKKQANLEALLYGTCQHTALNNGLRYNFLIFIQNLEYVSNEVDALYDCRSKLVTMDLEISEENKRLAKIYTAMVRQYKADIRMSEVATLTNDIIEMYD